MASAGFTTSKQRKDDKVDASMSAQIEKLLSEPTKLPDPPAGSKQPRPHASGDGMRIVGSGGRVRRFTESVAVNTGKYTVIHENGEWKASPENQVDVNEQKGEVAKADKDKSGKIGDEKGGKPVSLVKTERLPFGKNSKHSRSGLRGLPKKGGAGGKCVWGKPGSELQAEFDPAALDAGDPNYDSTDEVLPEQQANETAKPKMKKPAQTWQLPEDELILRIDAVLKEFFQHANVDDCIDSLGDLAFGRFVARGIAGSKHDNFDSNSSSAGGSPSAIGAEILTRSERDRHRSGAESQVSPSDSGYALSLVDGGRGGSAHANSTRNSTSESSVFAEVPQTRRYLVVYEALSLAFERHSADRELVSELLSELSIQRRLSNIDFAYGFEAVLRDLTDLRTDCPDAPKWTGMFIARAIDDEVLDNDAFLSAFRGRSRSPYMTMALETCSTLLEMRKPRSPSGNAVAGNGNGHTHALESGSKSSLNSAGSGSIAGLWNIWGISGATRPVNSLVREMRMLIDEYLTSDDCAEALRCLTELDVPHFHHELVYQAVLSVLESAHSARGAHIATRMSTLLRRFAGAGALPVDEMELGFRRVLGELPDLELDVPRATSAFEQFVVLCEHQGFLPRSVVKEVVFGKSGRKRYMSEADASVTRATDASFKLASDL